MRLSRVLVAAASGATALALALVAVPAPAGPAPHGPASAAPSQRGAPGTWTKINTGQVANTTEPGLLRTADGVLHVVYLDQSATTDRLGFTNISSRGKVVGTGTAVGGWAGLPQDPKLVPTPDGGMRLVFGGQQYTDVSKPYSSGQMFSATAPASGTTWTLQPGALTQSESGSASYGTGVTTLADGAPVVAFPLNDVLTWNVGGGATDSTATFPACCLYNVSLARVGDAVWSAFYANGSAEAHQGIFVKRLLPAEGPVVKAPQSTTRGSAVIADQAVPLIALPDGGLVTAYCVGYPTCTSIGIWRVGSAKPVAVPGSRDARELGVALAPGGRLWVAWSAGNGLVKVTHLGSSGVRFGAVTTLRAPKGATVYSLAIAASNGSADLVLGDGSSLFHQQVLPGLSLRAAPAKWKKNKLQKVTVTVTDAGAAIKGAKVRGGGASCTTAGNGRCRLTYPAGKAKRFWVTAGKGGYGAAQVRLTRR